MNGISFWIVKGHQHLLSNFSWLWEMVGHAVAQFVECAKSWKVTGSIPDGVTGIFHWHNPSSRTMALGSTQPLTEMSTRNNSWGVKVAGA
jgi:hypothetical protein